MNVHGIHQMDIKLEYQSTGCMSGVCLMVRVVGLGSEGPEFKSCSAFELTPGGIDSARLLSEVGKMSTSLLG